MALFVPALLSPKLTGPLPLTAAFARSISIHAPVAARGAPSGLAGGSIAGVAL